MESKVHHKGVPDESSVSGSVCERVRRARWYAVVMAGLSDRPV